MDSRRCRLREHAQPSSPAIAAVLRFARLSTQAQRIRAIRSPPNLPDLSRTFEVSKAGFKLTVRRYFSMAVGSAPEAFAALVGYYPAFELLPSDNGKERDG